jgi:hypothetical protein
MMKQAKSSVGCAALARPPDNCMGSRCRCEEERGTNGSALPPENLSLANFIDFEAGFIV